MSDDKHQNHNNGPPQRRNSLFDELMAFLGGEFIDRSSKKTTVKGDKEMNLGNDQELYNEAVNLHNLGVDGDKEAVKKSHMLFKKICEKYPKNIMAQAYLGSATSLLGRDAIDPNERFKLALEGLKMLDYVVHQEPENIEIRTLRAYVCYRLPEMYFHRTSTAVEDFSYMVSRYEKDNNTFSQEFYYQVLFDLGKAYKNLGRNKEAEATWRKLLSKTTGTKYRALIEQEGMRVDDLPEDPKLSEEVTVKSSEPAVKEEADVILEELLEEGKKLHSSALAGNKEAVPKAFEFFEEAYKKHPENSLVAAYYADCLSLVGRDANDPATTFGNAIKAMKIFDGAVNSDPDNIEVRLLRAYHSYRLPEAFFRRTATAIVDFEYLLQRYEEDNTVFPRDTYMQVLYDLGKSYKILDMDEESSATWLKLLAMDDDVKYKALISEQMDDSQEAESLMFGKAATKEELLKEGIRLHDLGVAGNKKAAIKAEELLKKAYEKDPDDPIAQGYYGSAMALVGRDSMDPSVMFGNAIKGLKLLKKAIGRDWNNPKLRLLRAYLAYNLPENFFHISQRAVKDFRFLKSAYEQDKSLFSEELYWQILYDLGVVYMRTGDNFKAQKVWKKLLQETSDPKYKTLLNDKMKGDDNFAF